MIKGNSIGTVIWVKNFSEILKKFDNKNLKRVSKAVICPHVTKHPCPSHEPEDSIDTNFFLIYGYLLSRDSFKI
jgi:hypothetical protein